jgi:hypothetical protein
VKQRAPVRLGKRGTDYIFERAVGLHEESTGIAVVGFDAHDPGILFEEHGLGKRCQYFELLVTTSNSMTSWDRTPDAQKLLRTC